jgi:cytochrome c2
MKSRCLILLGALTAYAATVGIRTAAPVVAQSSDEEHFKYGSVGIEDNEGFPYWIWQVLPDLCADKLPGPGGYASLGIVWEPNREMPVGFSKKDFWTGTRVAVNCAFCHVASWRRAAGDPPTLVASGPGNLINPQGYVRFLQACASDPRFTVDNVLAAIDRRTKLSATERLTYRLVLVPAVRKALIKQKGEYAWMDSRPPWGPGRIDPFNPVKFRMLNVPLDQTIGNSDMMPIWHMDGRRGQALHWDGLSVSLRETVLAGALGDGASRKSIDLASLERVETWSKTVKPPAYPFPVDAGLAAKGRPVFDAQCASCHRAGDARTGQVIPLAEIGTDRHRLDMWTAQSATSYNAFADGYAWDFKGFQKTDGYVAVPLTGLWLRAPYLHNGSVPYLAEILEPVDRRTKVFYRGYDVYDPARVGFVSEGPAAARGFRFDTSVRGNANQGHLYGVQLSPEEKRALVEYLKTL